MTHTSPTSFAVWSVLSTALGAFLLGHLYRFDKFKCLKWSNTPYSGAFKRIMTYSYLITIPLIMTYSFGFTYIKYKEGFVDIAGGIFPMPYNFWRKEYRDAVFPLMMIFAFAWSFEMVTHLEELCFWYFLITAGPAKPDWFRSVYFRIWVLGSVIALIYLPVVTIVHRGNPLNCEARMFTAGSAGDLVLTLAFIPILFRFPGFIRKVKAEGVDSSIIVRLRKFYELNVIRIIFRFLMQIPLLTLGIDGLKPHSHEINESLFWTDLLSTVAALGCVFSSICTLLIFFPRSYEAEYRAKEASHRRHSVHSVNSRQSHEPQPAYSQYGGDDEFTTDHHGDHNPFSPAGLRKSKSFNSIQKVSSDAGYYEADYNYNDPAAKLDDERNIGNGLVRERFGSKLRERERRITRGTKKFGYGLQDVFSRRFMRLPRAMRRGGRGGDTEGGSSGISLSRSMEREERDTETRRTTPSSRSAARKMSGNGGMDDEFPVTGTGVNAGDGAELGSKLERKGTYLLTDSPVLRVQRLHARRQESHRAGGGAAAASVENLEAAYEAGAGAGTAIDEPVSTSPIEIEIAYGTTTAASRIAQESRAAASGSGLASQFPDDKKVPPPPPEAPAVRISEDSNADIEELALDSPPPPPLSAAPSYAQAIGMRSLSPIQTSPVSPHAQRASSSANSPTGHGHVHGPRPIKKSMSISTTGTTATANRRALPVPPLGDPLGAAPAYYSPENSPFVTTQSHRQNSNDPQDRNDSGALGRVRSPLPPSSSAVGDLSTHPFASAQPAVSQGRHKSIVTDILPQSSDMAMHESADATPLSVYSRHITSAYLSSRYPQHERRPNTSGTNASALTAVDSDMRAPASGGAGTGMGLTAANLARLNQGSGAVGFASTSSQVNPLVRTFTSPIDFLDRIQENDSNESPVNASRTQIGWAV